MGIFWNNVRNKYFLFSYLFKNNTNTNKMKLYLNDKEKFVDVNFWSLMKANFLTSLAMLGIVWGSLFIIELILWSS